MDSTEEKKEKSTVDEKTGEQENKNDEKKDEKTGAGVFADWKLPDFSWKYVWIILNAAIIIFVIYKIAILDKKGNDPISIPSAKDESIRESVNENDPYTMTPHENSLFFYKSVKDSLDLYDKLLIKKNGIIQRTIEGTYNNDSIYCVMPLLENDGNILIITFKKNADGKKVYDLRILNDIDDKIIIENVSLKNIKRDSTKLVINYFNNKTNKNEKKEFTIPTIPL